MIFESLVEVMVIRHILDKKKVAWLLTSLLVLSPGLGIIAGLCTHNVDVGISVSAGVFALASFLPVSYCVDSCVRFLAQSRCCWMRRVRGLKNLSLFRIMTSE